MTHDELVDLGMVLAEVRELSGDVKALRAEVKVLKEATDTAFHAAQKVNKLVHKLSCMEEDTDPDCPVSLSEHPRHRESLHSVSELEEYSTVTAAAVKAATQAAIDTVKRSRSGFPIQFSSPNGWAVKLSAVGAGLIALAFVGWELFKIALHK